MRALWSKVPVETIPTFFSNVALRVYIISALPISNGDSGVVTTGVSLRPIRK